LPQNKMLGELVAKIGGSLMNFCLAHEKVLTSQKPWCSFWDVKLPIEIDR